MPQNADKSTEQKAAEAEVEDFRENLGPFVVAAETTRMAMVFTDAVEPENPIIFANEAFLTLTGYDRDEVLGQDFNFFMAHIADAETLAQIKSEFDGNCDSGSEVLYRRKDGSEFWAALFISPVRDERGEVVQHFASFVDLSKQKQEQAHSKNLIDELNHRVKNTLATVQSIVWQALRVGSDPKAIRQAIESRLFALSRSHDLLTRENWSGAALVDVINDALAPFLEVPGRLSRFVIKGPNIRLPPKATLALSIAFNELATNAMKYGALSNDNGSILIEWMIEPRPEGNWLVLRWQERDGPPVTPPSQKGFGSRVLESGVGSELEGSVQLDYGRDGVVCTISIPAPGPPS